MPLIQTGFSQTFKAFDLEASKRADEPVHKDEQSNNFNGGAIAREFNTSDTVIGFLNKAFGFFTALE
jgi:hypothetical protein